MIYAKIVYKEKRVKDKNVTLQLLAEKCSVSAPFISMVLNGQRSASVKVKRGLSKYFRISQEKLFSEYGGFRY